MTPQTDRRLSRARRGALGLAAAALAMAPQTARSAALHVFRLPAEPISQALERFAIQAGVSIGGTGCEGWSRPVAGVMGAETALARLLPVHCRLDRLDARSFRVTSQAPVPPPPRAAPPARPISELVVTAERRAEPLIGAPYAVSGLSGAEVRRLGGRSFADVAAQFVGVTATNLGSGRNKLFIRGLSDGSFTGRTQSTVGLYLDDVPVTYNAPDPDLRLADIARVEVLRGPQGTLYGSGSIGGIVRIITARPEPGVFAASVTAEGGATAHGAGSSGLEAWLNLPVADSVALRGVLYRDERGGYLDNPRLGLSDVNYSRRSGGRLAGLAALPGGWTLYAGLAHQSINTADTQYTAAAAVLDRDTALREPHDNDFSEATATLARSWSASELKLTAAYIDHQLDSRYDADDAFPGAVPAPAFVEEAQRVKLWLAEAQFIANPDARTSWLAGLSASRADEAEAAILSGGSQMHSLYRRADSVTEAAAFGEATYQFSPRVSVQAGGRLFTYRQETHADEFDLAPGGPAFAGRRTDSGFAGKLRVSYAWTPDTVVYAQAQDGYRSGGFNLPALARPGDPFVPDFRPDRLRNYEAGGVVPLFHRTLTLRAAVFHADWRSLQSDQFLAPGLPLTVNVGDGSNTGLEAEAVWRPDDHLEVRANVTLDDPQLTRTSALFPAQPDVGLPGVPYQMGGLDLRYQWRIGGMQAEVSAQASYVGRSYLTFAGEPASVMGGYGTGRLQGQIERGPWRLEGWIDNLADGHANTFAFGNPFTLSRGPQATPLRPRTLGVALTRDF